jgi:hypothetical protein
MELPKIEDQKPKAEPTKAGKQTANDARAGAKMRAREQVQQAG